MAWGTARETGTYCVGGPLHGKTTPARGEAFEIPAYADEWTNDPQTVTYALICYRRVQFRGHTTRGGYDLHDVYVLHGLTDEQAAAMLSHEPHLLGPRINWHATVYTQWV